MPPSPDLTRRAALASAALVVVVGCGEQSRRPTVPGAAPDDDLVAEVVAAITIVSSRLPRAPAFGSLRAMHAAHLDALAADPGARRRALTPAEALAAERRLQQRLVGWAVRAESGDLAALLASMSAAVAQQLAVRS